MSKQILGKVVPQRGTDYWTTSDKEEIIQAVSNEVEDKKQDYIDNANTYIEELTTLKNSQLADFNKNATNKTSEFNSLVATEKVNIESLVDDKETELTTIANTLNSNIDANAADKTSTFNSNVQEKTSQFNSNAATQTLQFTENVTTKEGEYNSNATTKLNEYNTNAEEKLVNYNENASGAIEAYNTNVTTKLNNFNSNVEEKLEAYNTNASGTIEAYNSNVTTKLNDFNSNATTKLEEYNTNAQAKLEEYNAIASSRLDSIDTRIEELEENIEKIETTRGHVYGIRRKITNNSNSAWERIFDSIGKVANATKNGGTVQNDFDTLAPWSEIKSCNYDLTTKKIKAWFGDANFKFDGTNGDVFTHIPKTYWKIYQENDYDYVLLADYPRAGFMEVEGFFAGRYNGSVVSDVLHSYSGLVPTTNKTIGEFRTLANALGDNFSQLDWRYFVLQMLYLVEYANYNSQSMLGNGVMNRKYVKTIVAENNTNRAIIGSASGYYIGQIIRIGTSDGGTQVADARKITAIEAYDDGTVTGSALTFDGAAVNIAVDNFVCTMAQETGQCDTLGMKSGCLNNDGYHSMIYRGVENLFANIWQWVDGINIKDHLAYICKDHSKYASDKFDEDYKPLAYTNCTSNGNPKTLGLDVDEPFFRFPTEVGGGTSTYICDYYYQNSGNRVALVGGNFSAGANAGLWYWNLIYTSSSAGWGIGCRVLIDTQ